jgi:hypothetical protein
LYVSGLFRRVRSDESDVWARAGFGGGAIMLITFAMVVITDILLTDFAISSPDATAVIMTLFKFHAGAFAVNAAILGAVLFLFAVASRKSNAFPSWLSIIGIIGGLLLFASAVPIDSVIGGSQFGMIGFGGFILWLIWLGVTSTKMLKG